MNSNMIIKKTLLFGGVVEEPIYIVNYIVKIEQFNSYLSLVLPYYAVYKSHLFSFMGCFLASCDLCTRLLPINLPAEVVIIEMIQHL